MEHWVTLEGVSSVKTYFPNIFPLTSASLEEHSLGELSSYVASFIFALNRFNFGLFLRAGHAKKVKF